MDYKYTHNIIDYSLPNPAVNNTRYSILNGRLTPRNDFGRDVLLENMYIPLCPKSKKIFEPQLRRSCYCDKNTIRYSDGKQYCGQCETMTIENRSGIEIKCGKPGHTTHHPGGIPYTGSWCNFHYLELVKKSREFNNY